MSADIRPVGYQPVPEVASITFEDGSRVQPTHEGVRAIERLVREGKSLRQATTHITGGPRIVRQPRQVAISTRANRV